ncbi:hypothetical protein, partial [Nocardia altamirensis]|uniref:hypothetical protein n=1 Tax=Nocardia altamirensis TaxID=472158 RepID=UPI001C3F95CE
RWRLTRWWSAVSGPLAFPDRLATRPFLASRSRERGAGLVRIGEWGIRLLAALPECRIWLPQTWDDRKGAVGTAP